MRAAVDVLVGLLVFAVVALGLWVVGHWSFLVPIAGGPFPEDARDPLACAFAGLGVVAGVAFAVIIPIAAFQCFAAIGGDIRERVSRARRRTR